MLRANSKSETLPQAERACADSRNAAATTLGIGLLTGGDDRSYALGLACALAEKSVAIDFVGSDKLDAPELHDTPAIRFLNLRGDQREDAPMAQKVLRLVKYYARLIGYALKARPRIFHILWNNKFEYFDRTLLMLYYRLCGRKIVFTAHNVNAARRDSRDSALNRATLKVQYSLCDHIFVHTQHMSDELRSEFGVAENKISVIPFGINDTSPRTGLTTDAAKQQLGLRSGELTLLFFGQIAPYKGLLHLVEAMSLIVEKVPAVRLVIAGKVKKGSEDYWRSVSDRLTDGLVREKTICRIEHIPDSDVEIYFKAADALVVPYVQIFQSGVPFLSYSFGLPVIATDVGSLADEILEGETGFTCAPQDAVALAGAVERYARSTLYRELRNRRDHIAANARQRHSWTRVADITYDVYSLLSRDAAGPR